jgi:hypothetical protein
MAGFSQLLRRLLHALSASQPERPAMHWPLPGEVRAIRLLVPNLSPAQREQYNAHRYFDVVGGSTGKRYRIRYGPHMNVEELDCYGQRAYLLCFTPEGGLPIGDMMLAQKIALELFEDEVLWIANRAHP